MNKKGYTEMYRALRIINDKINRGYLLIQDKTGKISMKEQLFVATKVATSIAVAEIGEDPEILALKEKYDQSKE